MLNSSFYRNWQVSKIGVIGPGIVGTPMAALLAQAKIKIGTDRPARVVVIQRESITSGWKVGAINSGRSPIGGIEPLLDEIIAQSITTASLYASHDYNELSDADVILVCVQTDKNGNEPDYGPLFESLNSLVKALHNKPSTKMPLIIFESTLAPSSMNTVIRDYFAKNGLVDGHNLLLGNSPNRVMPGRLVERVTTSDKIVAGIHPLTPHLIQRLYSHIVTEGKLFLTNSLTAEVVKTLENAYRDVRIAFSSEVVRYCDQYNIDFYYLRDRVNERLGQKDDASNDPGSVPRGGLLIPTVGVGGHCLPKDGILLWWRMLQSHADTSRSLILLARTINDESPAETIRLAETTFGEITGKKVALLGAAYRFDSEDTRNSPTLVLARLLAGKSCQITIHDPYVKESDQNLKKFNLQGFFTSDLGRSLENAEVIFVCTAHRLYRDLPNRLVDSKPLHRKIIDGCNIFKKTDFIDHSDAYIGIGKGSKLPDEGLIDTVHGYFRIIERGIANEVLSLITYLNANYAKDNFNRIVFEDVQKLAATCGTCCDIVAPGVMPVVKTYQDFSSRMVEAVKQRTSQGTPITRLHH